MSCQFVGCGFSAHHFVGTISQEAAEDRADDRERSASPLHEPADAAKDPETQTSLWFCYGCLLLFLLWAGFMNVWLVLDVRLCPVNL